MTGVLLLSLVFAVIGVRLCWKRFAEKLAWIAGTALLLVALAGLVAWFLWKLFAQVFSLHGLAYSFGFVGSTWDESTLSWPVLVQVTTWLLTIELLALGVFIVHMVKGRGRATFIASWLQAHPSLITGPASAFAWYLVLAPGTATAAKCHGLGFSWPARQHGREMADLAAALVEDAWSGVCSKAASWWQRSTLLRLVSGLLDLIERRNAIENASESAMLGEERAAS